MGCDNDNTRGEGRQLGNHKNKQKKMYSPSLTTVATTTSFLRRSVTGEQKGEYDSTVKITVYPPATSTSNYSALSISRQFPLFKKPFTLTTIYPLTTSSQSPSTTPSALTTSSPRLHPPSVVQLSFSSFGVK